MTNGSRRCPRCDAPVPEGLLAHHCVRIDADHPTERIESRLEDTIAYRGEATMAMAMAPTEIPHAVHPDLDDGFPVVDDLVDRELGQYRLESVVGKGSMGRVYRAEHLGLARACAIKVMNPGLVARQPQIRERFWDEARAVANLLHPHVVMVHNLGSDRGYHFIEMEYIPGGTSLREILVREGPFEPVRASTLVRQVVLALSAAHHSGMVHRDVKPSNVLMTAGGQAKLADFGLVRRRSELELAGVPVAGTPTFMAPELFSGVPASPRSDIYAVGVMYYYLLSARLPFASDQISRLIQLHRTEPLPEIRTVAPRVPDVVADVLNRCLAKRPEERYQTAEDLAEDLQVAIYHLRDTDSLVRESIEGLECTCTDQGEDDHYRLVFSLPNDRIQEVRLEVSPTRDGERLLSVFSVCGPADPAHFDYALRLNDKLTYGSLSIRNVNDQPMFVMTRTFSRDRVCAEDIRAALVEIARRSDNVEQLLTNADCY